MKMRHLPLLFCLLMIIVAFLQEGCSRRQPSPSGRTISNSDLKQVMWAMGAFGEQGSREKNEGSYALLTPEFVENELSQAWFTVLGEVASAYQVGRNDCQDFARGFAWASQQFGMKLQEAPAVLEFCYDWGPGRGHCLNAIFVLENGQTNVWFWEPQTDQRVFLSPEQVRSCTWWRAPE
jgi:hypothetical protein